MCTIKLIGNDNNNYCFGAFDVPDMMPHAYNPNIQDAETGGSYFVRTWSKEWSPAKGILRACEKLQENKSLVTSDSSNTENCSWRVFSVSLPGEADRSEFTSAHSSQLDVICLCGSTEKHGFLSRVACPRD